MPARLWMVFHRFWPFARREKQGHAMNENKIKDALAKMLEAFTGDGFECESCRLQQTTCENNDPTENEQCPIQIALDAIKDE